MQVFQAFPLLENTKEISSETQKNWLKTSSFSFVFLVSREKFFKIFLKESDHQRGCWLLCSKKIVNKGLFILHSFSTDNKCSTTAIRTLAWHSSETNFYLKIEFCTDAYFYETLYLKIGCNLQSWAGCLGRDREIQQNWTGQGAFDISFCVFFDCCCQGLISGGETGDWA